MISVTQLRGGVTFLIDNEPFKVIKYEHTHMSRGGGTIKLKIRNLINGNVIDKTYKSGDRVDEAELKRTMMQYLYREGDDYFFMDSTDFSQVTIDKTHLEESAPYLVQGQEYMVIYWYSPKSEDYEPLDVEVPPKVTLKITQAAPGVKGDTAASVYKDALLENGLKVRVPLFVNSGEMIRVDTRTGEYVERA